MQRQTLTGCSVATFIRDVTKVERNKKRPQIRTCTKVLTGSVKRSVTVIIRPDTENLTHIKECTRLG